MSPALRWLRRSLMRGRRRAERKRRLGLLDIQINGAYGVDLSVYNGDAPAHVRGLERVAVKIVETGVTALIRPSSCARLLSPFCSPY
jgi:hypothetical protein